MSDKQCQFTPTGERDARGRYQFRCPACGTTLWLPTPAAVPRGNCVKHPPPPPAEGPGTELKNICEQLGFTPRSSCQCDAKASQMNLWGVSGCEANFDIIVGWMREAYDLTSWSERTTAAARALATGLAFQLDWRDPPPSLVRLAIARARAAAQG